MRMTFCLHKLRVYSHPKRGEKSIFYKHNNTLVMAFTVQKKISCPQVRDRRSVANTSYPYRAPSKMAAKIKKRLLNNQQQKDGTNKLHVKNSPLSRPRLL